MGIAYTWEYHTICSNTFYIPLWLTGAVIVAESQDECNFNLIRTLSNDKTSVIDFPSYNKASLV